MMGRYDRQMRFEPFGESGQRALREANIFVLGAGALGSASAEMLVRAGVGRLTIVDRDVLEWTNLHRQQLYTESDVERQLPKAAAAHERLTAINRDVTIEHHVVDITSENILSLVEGHTAVLDATDNLETRLLANDACLQLGIPFFMGACVGSYGMTFPIGLREEEPCLHCLLETLPPEAATCDTVGVISPIVVTVAARQTAQLLRYLAGETWQPTLQSTNLWTDEHASIRVTSLKKESCPSCSNEPVYPFLRAVHETEASVLCGRETVQLRLPLQRAIDLQTFASIFKRAGSTPVVNQHLVSGHWNDYRIVFFKDGRILVHGTNDPKKARSLVASMTG